MHLLTPLIREADLRADIRALAETATDQPLLRQLSRLPLTESNPQQPFANKENALQRRAALKQVSAIIIMIPAYNHGLPQADATPRPIVMLCTCVQPARRKRVPLADYWAMFIAAANR